MAELPPILVRLELQGMTHQIVKAFSAHQLDIEQQVNEIVEAELAKFDFGQEIRNTVYRELPKMIESAVSSALRRQVFSADIEKILDAAVIAGAAGLLTKAELNVIVDAVLAAA